MFNARFPIKISFTDIPIECFDMRPREVFSRSYILDSMSLPSFPLLSIFLDVFKNGTNFRGFRGGSDPRNLVPIKKGFSV